VLTDVGALFSDRAGGGLDSGALGPDRVTFVQHSGRVTLSLEVRIPRFLEAAVHLRQKGFRTSVGWPEVLLLGPLFSLEYVVRPCWIVGSAACAATPRKSSRASAYVRVDEVFPDCLYGEVRPGPDDWRSCGMLSGPPDFHHHRCSRTAHLEVPAFRQGVLKRVAFLACPWAVVGDAAISRFSKRLGPSAWS